VWKLVFFQCLPHTSKHVGFVIGVQPHNSTICSEGHDEGERGRVGMVGR
jgi:hypothetical protein